MLEYLSQVLQNLNLSFRRLSSSHGCFCLGGLASADGSFAVSVAAEFSLVFILKLILSQCAGCKAAEVLDSISADFQRGRMGRRSRGGRGGGRQPNGKEKGRAQRKRVPCPVTSNWTSPWIAPWRMEPNSTT